MINNTEFKIALDNAVDLLDYEWQSIHQQDIPFACTYNGMTTMLDALGAQWIREANRHHIQLLGVSSN